MTAERPDIGKEPQTRALIEALEGGDRQDLERWDRDHVKKIKSKLSLRARELSELGLFPQEDIVQETDKGRVNSTSQLLSVEFEGAMHTEYYVALDPSANMFICDAEIIGESPQKGSLGLSLDWHYAIDWDSKRPATDQEYIEYGHYFIKEIANAARRGLGQQK